MRDLQLDEVEPGLGHVPRAGDEVVADPRHVLGVERAGRLAERDVGQRRGAEERRLRDARRGLVAVVGELPAHLRALGVHGLGDAAVAGDAARVAREHERRALAAVARDDRRLGADEPHAAAGALAVVRDVRLGGDELARVGEEEPVGQERDAVSQLVPTHPHRRREVRERAHRRVSRRSRPSP